MRGVNTFRRILRINSEGTCELEGGSCWKSPHLLTKFLRLSDRLAFSGDRSSGVCIERLNPDGRPVSYLYCRVSGWTGPVQTKAGEHTFRGVVAGGPVSPFLSADGVAAYFYQAGAYASLYEQAGASREADAGGLRNSWRLWDLELAVANTAHTERLRIERAFNILMNPDLRSHYDQMLFGEEDPLPIPYAGPAEVLVEGKLTEDGGAFFGKRIVAYRPEMEKRTVSLLLRSCEFLEDRVICRDHRHKMEVWLDRAQLPGISWDLTWNHSKRWLQSRLTVEATFVRTQAQDGEIPLIALPSRTQVVVPEGINDDIARAAKVQRLVGQNVDVLTRIRSEIQAAPVEYIMVQQWLDHLGVGDIGPELAIWEPDYDVFYFKALREGSSSWFLFRNEFLFILPQAIVAEIPQAGHASYVFAKPPDVSAFLDCYARVDREDIRHNRNNAATELGFIRRVARGVDRVRWAENVFKMTHGTSRGS